MIHVVGTRNISIRQEGERVLVIENGRTLLDLPYQAALQLATALRVKSGQAEEWANREAVVYDQAILTRLGIPFGLTANSILLGEAAKEAAWNSQLRRYIPPDRAGGINSGEVFGTPSIIMHKKGE